MPDIVNDDDLSALAAEYVLGTLDSDERTRANVLLDVDHGFRGLVRVWERRLGELHLMVEPVEPDARLWERIRSKVAAAQPSPSVAPLAPLASEPPEPPKPPETLEIPEEPAKAATPADAGTSTHEQRLAELMLEVEKFSERRTPEPPAEPEPAEAERVEREAAEPRLPERVTREVAPAVLLPPALVTQPRTKSIGRGWRAYGLLMTLVAFGLGGLIASWRFIPDSLPLLLRPIAFLRLLDTPSPPPKKRPPPGFDE